MGGVVIIIISLISCVTYGIQSFNDRIFLKTDSYQIIRV